MRLGAVWVILQFGGMDILQVGVTGGPIDVKDLCINGVVVAL